MTARNAERALLMDRRTSCRTVTGAAAEVQLSMSSSQASRKRHGCAVVTSANQVYIWQQSLQLCVVSIYCTRPVLCQDSSISNVFSDLLRRLSPCKASTLAACLQDWVIACVIEDCGEKSGTPAVMRLLFTCVTTRRVPYPFRDTLH